GVVTTAQAAQATAVANVKRGGAWRYPSASVDAMDPATAQPTPLWWTTYEWLGVWKQTEGKALPALATSWEQPDASTLIFNLNASAKWQNKAPVGGRKLTSDDIKFSLNYFNSPD